MAKKTEKKETSKGKGEGKGKAAPKAKAKVAAADVEVLGQGEAEAGATPGLAGKAGTEDYSTLPMDERRARQCLATIEQAIKQQSVLFFDLSMAMLEAHENRYAEAIGLANFREYVEQRLDMKYRRAMYFVDIAKAIRSARLERAQVEAIGWTKLKEISGLILEKPEDAERLLALAEGKSTSELKTALASEVKVTAARAASPGIMRLSLKFEGDSMGLVSDALRVAYSEIGREDISQGLEHIVAEWMMAKKAVPEGATVSDWVGYIERTYGVKLQQVDQGEASLDAVLGSPDVAAADADNLEALLGADSAGDVENLVGL